MRKATVGWRWLILAPPLAFYAIFIARTPVSFEGRSWFWLFDDAMISMRYARNLADGEGLVWNAGERVEGYSNLLWTLVMAGVHAVGLSDSGASLAMIVLGAALLIATAFVAGWICAELAPGNEMARLVAMALTAAFYPLVYWSLHGVEAGLAALLIGAGVLLALRLAREWQPRRCWALAAVLCAAVLTRDDLALPAVVIVAWLAWRLPREQRRQAVAVLAGTLLATVAAHTAFRLAYYDSALPNTYYLKLSGIGLGTRLARGAEVLAYTFVTQLYAPLLLAGALRRRVLSPALALLAGLFVAQCAYSLYVGGDAFEALRLANRYIAVAAPLLIVLAALGLDELLRAARAGDRRPALAVAAAIGVVALLQIGHVVPTHRFDEGLGDGIGALLPAVALGLALLLVAVAVSRVRTAAVVAALLAVAVVAAVDAGPVREWARSKPLDQAFEEGWVRTGLLVRRLTPPDTSVAMAAAGNIGYFSRRPAIDLLGRSDAVVAREPPRSPAFRPGHDKWDYEHSIGRLRPDLIADMGPATPTDLCALRGWGYRRLGPLMYAHGRALGGRAGQPIAPPPGGCPPATGGAGAG